MRLFKSKLTALIAIIFFSVLMLFEISIDLNGETAYQNDMTIESVNGASDSNECSKIVRIGFIDSIASDPGHDEGGDGGCSAISCIISSPCSTTGPCSWRETCNGCSCGFAQTDFGGSDRCGE